MHVMLPLFWTPQLRWVFFQVYIYILFVLFHASEVFSSLCSVMHKAIWHVRFITLGGEEVLRAADRLHKPLLPHKSKHILSNCQNSYFKDCDRSARVRFSIAFMSAVFVRKCLCVSLTLCLCDVCVFYQRVHLWACMHVCVRIFSMPASFFWQTLHSDLFYWSLQLLYCT